MEIKNLDMKLSIDEITQLNYIRRFQAGGPQ